MLLCYIAVASTVRECLTCHPSCRCRVRGYDKEPRRTYQQDDTGREDDERRRHVIVRLLLASYSEIGIVMEQNAGRTLLSIYSTTEGEWTWSLDISSSRQVSMSRLF